MAAEAKLEAIIEALEMAEDFTSSYLDLETGEVHTISEEASNLASQEEESDQEAPEWEREEIALARKIEQDGGKRYLELPGKFDIHEWGMMELFAESLTNEKVRNAFRIGIHGKGAFRAFKDLLTGYTLWDRWNKFKRAELQKIAEEWCEENGIRFREGRA